MPVQPKLKLRYEIGEVLGQGGMGVVYKAHDTVLNRDVAVKTLRNSADSTALQLFQKECQVLASISHPNIVEIFDIGELLEDSKHIPFFVMPLLRGVGLDRLIRESSARLTVERCVEVFSQTCRGLHAAHEHGLVHRDLKPSNLFVMNDDSVKVIDFGVALMVDSRATRGIKGTLLYMAPEQIEMKPLSALSDVFSLGVVCYETLTGRRPFERATEGAVAQAILHDVPQPVSELNPAVNAGLSRVVHKAMAKQPWHRFTSAHEFADALQRALRGEALDFFDPAKIQPRIQRIRKALDQSDLQFAGEILDEIEAEGHVDPEISQLRREIDRSQRQKTVRQLIESARTRFEEDEYPLALQKIQEALQLDPENASALGLKSTIESHRSERKMDDWFRLAHQHISNHGYAHAREAIKNVLQLRPKSRRALQLLAEVDRREREYFKLREEKELGYKAAMEAWNNGEVSSALSKMNAVLDLVHRSPESVSPDRSAVYQNFYNQVRSEYDAMNRAHAEARKHLADRNFAAAVSLCESYLSKFPDNTLFRALKFDIDEQQRQSVSAFVAEVDRAVETEPDLSRRVTVLEDALVRYPGEAHFEHALHLMREKRELVNSIVAKARIYEDHSQFSEAVGQWEILRTIYPQYPGLSFETERVVKRLEQQVRTDSKAHWVSQIEDQLRSNIPDRALELSLEALGEFPDDGELLEIEKACHLGIERAAQVQTLLSQAEQHGAQGRADDQIEFLRQAIQLSPSDPTARAVLLDALTERARRMLEMDWQTAEPLIDEALTVDPDYGLANSLKTLVEDRKRNAFVDGCLSQARQLQTTGEIAKARAEIESGLAVYPEEPRLRQRYAALVDQETQTLSRENRKVRLADVSAPAAEAGVRRLATAASQPAPRPPSIPSAVPPSSRLQQGQTAEAESEPLRQVEVSQTVKPTERQPIFRWVLPVLVGVTVFAIVAGLLLWHFHQPTNVAEVATAQPAATSAVPTPVPTPSPNTASSAVTTAVPPEIPTAASRAAPHGGPPVKGRVPRAPSKPKPSAVSTSPVSRKALLSPVKNSSPENPPISTNTKTPQQPASSNPPSLAAQSSSPPKSPLNAKDKLAQIAGLSALAYQADIHGNYFSPKGTNAVAYSQQILERDPKNVYALKLIVYSVNQGKDLVQKDIAQKKYALAQQTCNAMLQLLPGRRDLVALQQEVAPLAGLRVKFLQKQPAGSFLEGILTVANRHLKFAGAVSGAQSTNLDIACSHVRNFKIGTEISSPQQGFELQTKAGDYNFVPEDMPAPEARNAIKSACSLNLLRELHF